MTFLSISLHTGSVLPSQWRWHFKILVRCDAVMTNEGWRQREGDVADSAIPSLWIGQVRYNCLNTLTSCFSPFWSELSVEVRRNPVSSWIAVHLLQTLPERPDESSAGAWCGGVSKPLRVLLQSKWVPVSCWLDDVCMWLRNLISVGSTLW